MMKLERALLCIIAIVFAFCVIFFNFTTKGIRVRNTFFSSLQKEEDNSSYETRKKVEDTCRAMVSSYNSDKSIYDQYKDSSDTQKQEWAESAKIRANKTAFSYNDYILKNSYVWEENIPEDIKESLTVLE